MSPQSNSSPTRHGRLDHTIITCVDAPSPAWPRCRSGATSRRPRRPNSHCCRRTREKKRDIHTLKTFSPAICGFARPQRVIRPPISRASRAIPDYPPCLHAYPGISRHQPALNRTCRFTTPTHAGCNPECRAADPL